MLSDVEKGNNLRLTTLTLVATLTDTKQQSATTSCSTQILTFPWHLRSRRDARVDKPMPKERLLGKGYQRNQIHLHWRKPKILTGYSVAITKTGRQSLLQRNQLLLLALILNTRMPVVRHYLKCPRVVILTTSVILHKKKDFVHFRLYIACIYFQKGKLVLSMFILEFYLHAWDICSIALWDILR